jgi:glycosyltransferase involved in cell wall biosynthesis
MYFKKLLLYLVAFTLNFSIKSDPERLLTVVLMVRDEANSMINTLAPFVESGVTSYLIYDTGSVDKTIEVTKDYFKSKNITDYHIIQETWMDFSRSRNRALDLAQEKFPNMHFMVMPDAEWYLHNGTDLLNFCRANKDNPNPVYLIHITSPTINFYHARLFKGNSKVRFEGAVHEVPNFCTNQRVPSQVHFELRMTQAGLEKSARRFHRDLRLLLNSFINEPTNPRTAFYLAQTYQCLGDLINACKYYEFRIKLNRPDEENYIATLRLAELHQERAKQDATITWHSVLQKYLETYTLRPHRIEPLIKIAEYYLEQGNNALAYLFAHPTIHVPYPEHDYLFVDQRYYNFTRYDIIGRAAWYVGEFEIGEQALRKALEVHPDSLQLHRNLSFYIKRKERLALNQQATTKIIKKTNLSPVINIKQAKPELVVVVTSYNNKDYWFSNIDSLVHQKDENGHEFENVEIIIIDDASIDGTGEFLDTYVKNNHLEYKVKIIRNKQRVGALANLYNTISQLPDHKIVLTVDGDDPLAHDKVFARIAKEYQNPNTWLTYGQYMYYPEGTIGVCKELPEEVKKNNNYRDSGVWITSQLRTFRAGLFKKIKREDLLYENKFYEMAWDLAMMYPMIEMAQGHIVFIPDVLYIYNHHNPISDHNKSRELQLKLTHHICAKQKYKPLQSLNLNQK